MSQLRLSKRKRTDGRSPEPLPAKRTSIGSSSPKAFKLTEQSFPRSPAFSAFKSPSDLKLTPDTVDASSRFLPTLGSSFSTPRVFMPVARATKPATVTSKEIHSGPTAHLSIPDNSYDCPDPLENRLLRQEDMTADQVLRAIVRTPMESSIVTSMSSVNIATNHFRVKDKLKHVENLHNQLTATLGQQTDEKHVLEAQRLHRLEELERVQYEYNEIKEKVGVLDSVIAENKSKVMKCILDRSDLGILVEVLQKLKDTLDEERPFGKVNALPIEQIRITVGCPTPESCFKLLHRTCVAINFVFLTFGYFTHPVLTGLWKIPLNGNKEEWVKMYGVTPSIKTRKASLKEMQKRIHDYLAFVSAKPNPVSDVRLVRDVKEEEMQKRIHDYLAHLVRDVKEIPTHALALYSAEYERRMQTDTSRDERAS